MKRLLVIIGLICSIGLFAQTPFLGNNNLWGVKDDAGNIIVPCIYKNVAQSNYSGGLLGVAKKNRWGFIDKTGKVVIPFNYVAISTAGFSEGLLACAKNSTWGYIDNKGNSIIPSQYVFAAPFGDGVALVAKGNKVFFIDKGGNPVESLRIPNLADGYMFHDGKCVVGIRAGSDIKYGVIDRQGKWIISALYDEFCINISDPPFDSNGIAEVVINGKTKYLNQEGREFETLALAMQLSNSDSNNRIQGNEVADNSRSDSKQDKSSSENQRQELTKITKVDNQQYETTPIKENVGGENTFAVIIANENYRREADVDFALNDGKFFKEYCHLYLDLPLTNVHYVENATLNDMKAEINWIINVADAYDGKAKLIFYYAGHGIPDESSRASYLLPADGFGSDVSTGYKLDDLYAKFSSVKAECVLTFLDACFSGAQRDGNMMASARGIAIKAKQSVPRGNLVVFSAAQGDETAYPYKEKEHGLFTYYLLQKIKETNGKVSLGDLAEYISDNVRKKAIVINSKSQTPSIIASPEMMQWETMLL